MCFGFSSCFGCFDKYTQLAYIWFVEFFETAAFVRIINDYLDDEELRHLQSFLLLNPDAGKVIRKGKGSRKLRWATKTTGKVEGYESFIFTALSNIEFTYCWCTEKTRKVI